MKGSVGAPFVFWDFGKLLVKRRLNPRIPKTLKNRCKALFYKALNTAAVACRQRPSELFWILTNLPGEGGICHKEIPAESLKVEGYLGFVLLCSSSTPFPKTSCVLAT